MINQNSLAVIVATTVLLALQPGNEVLGDIEKKFIHFSFITALTGDSTSSGGIPVIDFALEQINNDSRLLPNYTLKYTEVLDSKVNIYVQLHYLHTRHYFTVQTVQKYFCFGRLSTTFRWFGDRANIFDVNVLRMFLCHYSSG